MAHKNVENAVEARLRAGFTRAPILTENQESETPGDGSAFVELQFPVSDAERWAMGSRVYRETGGFRIVISLPVNSGIQLMRDWGEEIGALFCDAKFDGVVCQVPSDPFTDQRRTEGSYFQGSVVCPYTYNFTR